MHDSYFYQYAFSGFDCLVEDIGPGIDARYDVELIKDEKIAAVVSRIGADQIQPERLQGRTAEEVRWLSEVAARHNEIVCRAAESSAVLPLRLGTVFQSRGQLLETLRRCRPAVAEFLRRFGDRQEWRAKLYRKKFHLETVCEPAGAPAPHSLNRFGGIRCFSRRKKSAPGMYRELQVAARRTIQAVESRLADLAELCQQICTPAENSGSRSGEMVFNGAFLLPSSAKERWLETVDAMRREVHGKGLLLEVSGPWPPYHFCPSLELRTEDSVVGTM